jgi:hypothetical protein
MLRRRNIINATPAVPRPAWLRRCSGDGRLRLSNGARGSGRRGRRLGGKFVRVTSQAGFVSLVIRLVLAVGDGGATTPTRPPSLAPRSLLAPLPDAPPSTLVDEYRLLRAKDGSGDLLYEAPGFMARVARDGSVGFRDKHIGGINFLPFLVGPAPTGVPTLQSTLRGMGRKRGATTASAGRSDPTADETRMPSTTVSRYRPDVREACQYPQSCFFDAAVLVLGAHARVDISDEVLRFAGQDPYRYDKARFLGATRDLRIRMAARAHAENIKQSGAALPALLETIACDDGMSRGERREILVALRAELDVDTPEARAYRDRIQRFLQSFDHADGGGRCPPR